MAETLQRIARRAAAAALAALLAAAWVCPGALAQDKDDDLVIREFDEIVMKDNPRKVWRGFFQRDEKGDPEVLPNGRWIFTLQESGQKGIVQKVLPSELQSVRYKQTEEEVWRKMTARLRAERLNINEFYTWADKCIGKDYLALAEDILRRALALDTQSIETYTRLGALLGRQFKFEAELNLYDGALALKIPQSFQIVSLKAALLLRLGLEAEAEKAWLEALSAEPRHVDSLVGLGRLYLFQRRFREAETKLNAARTVAGIDKQRVSVLKWLGMTCLKLGKFEDARKHFEEATLLAPEDGETKNFLGSIYFYGGEVARAKEKYLEILGLTPEDLAAQMSPPAEGEGEGGGEGEGVKPAEEGAEKTASDPFGPANDFDPLKSKVMSNLALCLLRENANYAAEQYLKLSAGLDPTSPLPWLVLGYLREREGKYFEADEAYRKALSIEPASAQAHYAAGILRLRAGDLGASRDEFLAATEADPDFTDALVKLGFIALNEGRPDDALLFLKNALSLCPNVADWHVALGVAYCMKKQYVPASEAFVAALNRDAANPIAKVGSKLALYYSHSQGQALDEEAYIQLKRMLEEESAGMPEKVKLYLKTLVTAIEENRGKVQWVDDFERRDSDQIAKKWESVLGTGPLMRLHKGRAAIEGNQVKTGETVLERPVPSEKFVRFEADLFLKQMTVVEAGLQVVYRVSTSRGQGDIRAGVRIGKNAKGNLALWEYDTSVSRWKEFLQGGSWPASEKGDRLAIELVKAGETSSMQQSFAVRFLLNGVKVGEDLDSDRFRRGFKTGEIWVGLYTSSERGNEVKLTVDNVRLVTWK